MDAKRAKQIIESPDGIKVTYRDDSVWIDTVNPEAGTATVHNVNDPEEEIDVPVQELKEHAEQEIDFR
ncbi:MAG TPA: H-type small acid-soluble spore protein [Bacillales bacterium]|nr:H-type small acid-soluble spore protein [Bacillales bacterium]